MMPGGGASRRRITVAVPPPGGGGGGGEPDLTPDLTPMPEDFSAFMGAAVPHSSGPAAPPGPPPPPSGPAHEAQLARARASGRRPPARTESSRRAQEAAVASAWQQPQQQQQQQGSPPSQTLRPKPAGPMAAVEAAELAAREAAQRSLEIAEVQRLSSGSFERPSSTSSDDLLTADQITEHMWPTKDDSSQVSEHEWDAPLPGFSPDRHVGSQSKYLERAAPVNVAAAKLAQPEPPSPLPVQTLEKTAARRTGAGVVSHWPIALSQHERTVLVAELGAAEPADLAFVSVEQLQALDVRPVIMAKLLALRERLIEEASSGRRRRASKGARGGGGCCCRAQR